LAEEAVAAGQMATSELGGETDQNEKLEGKWGPRFHLPRGQEGRNQRRHTPRPR